LLEEVQEKDKLKDEALQQAGFTIMRFTDNEVLNHIDQVRRNIASWIEEGNFPPPNPRQRGTTNQ
jgi:very-short-patch-repair endonuclease